jgi:hypothetical protein
MDRCQIHGKPVLRTAHPQHPSLFALFLPFGREVPSLARITDDAARKRACVCERIGREGITALFKLNVLHLNVMCVTKGAEILFGSLYSHSVSLDKLPSKLAELRCFASLRIAREVGGASPALTGPAPLHSCFFRTPARRLPKPSVDRLRGRHCRLWGGLCR